MPQHNNRELITIKEASMRMGVSRVTVERWLKAGRLEHALTPVGRRLIYADALIQPTTPQPDQAA